MRFAFLLGLVAFVAAVAQINGGQHLRRLYDQHRWFELRSVIRRQPDAPPLYRGAVAAAFDDRSTAEAAFAELFQKEPRSYAAYQGHEWLTYLYMRHGLYGEAIAATKAKWQALPSRSNSPEEHEIIEMLQGVEDQTVVASVPSSVKLQANGNIPLVVHGNAADFLIDTDSNFSFISESAAKAFGLPIRVAGVEAHGAAGKQEHVSTAVSDLSIGGFRLTHVLFLVFPDSMGAFGGAPVRDQGALGIPVLLALQRLRITSSGMCTIGGSPDGSSEIDPNLAFDGEDPIIQVNVLGHEVEMIFDSGSNTTELFPPFAAEFPGLFRGALPAPAKREGGFGGERSIKQLEISTLKIEFGGFSATLHPAHLLEEKTVAASAWAAGRLGGDTMQQPARITLDFRGMRVEAG